MSWRDEAYELYLDEMGVKVIRQVGVNLKIEDIQTTTYEHIIVDNPWRWMHNRFVVTIFLLLATLNVWSNYYFYLHFASYDGQPYVDIAQILKLQGASEQYFPLSILGFTGSSLMLALLFLGLKNLLLYRVWRYLFIVEVLSLIGVMSGIFWAALFSWIAVGTYMCIKFDIRWVKPSKEQQILYSESIEKLQKKGEEK